MRYDFIHIDVFTLLIIDVFLTKSILPLKYFSSSAISSDVWASINSNSGLEYGKR